MNFHKEKYHNYYWDICDAAAKQSVCNRHKVGAVVVTPTGMISTGWNGTPPGFPNECEEWVNHPPPLQRSRTIKTLPHVIHAERNAIDKMTRTGIPLEGSILFVSRSPCIECSKSIMNLGITQVHYDELHDENTGLSLLEKMGIKVIKRSTSEMIQFPLGYSYF